MAIHSHPHRQPSGGNGGAVGKVSNTAHRRISSSDRIGRILKIYRMLCQGIPCNSVTLAQEFAVDGRTIKRDITLLKRMQFPIEYDHQHKTYRLAMLRNGDCFSIHETMILLMGLTVLQRVPSGVEQSAIDSVKSRLQLTIPDSHRDTTSLQCEKLDNLIFSLLRPDTLNIHSTVFNTLRRAFALDLPVEVEYFNGSNELHHSDVLSELHIFVHNGKWYLQGHSRKLSQTISIYINSIYRAKAVLPSADAEADMVVPESA